MSGSRRVSTSEWLLTINSNQRFRDETDLQEAANEFGKLVQANFSNRRLVFDRFLKIMPSNQWVNTDNDYWPEDLIGTADFEAVVEYASSGLHCHILVKICHVTLLHLDTKQIADAFPLPFGRVYVNVRSLRNNRRVRDYIFKNVRGYDLRMCNGQEFPEIAELRCRVYKGVVFPSPESERDGAGPVDQGQGRIQAAPP